MAMQSKALRVGIITAAVVGTVAIPATALAANASAGMNSLMGSHVAMQVSAHGEHDMAGPARRGGDDGVEHLAGLAASLGIEVDTLKAALEETRAELDGQKPTTPEEREAFKELHLTTFAAALGVTTDVLQAAMDANPAEHGEGRGHDKDRGNHVGTLATALGVTPDVLATAMREARDETKPAERPTDEAAREAQQDAYLAVLTAKLGIPVDELQTAMDQAKPERPARPTAEEQRATLEPRLAAMVESGKLTQEQANQILADLDAGKPVFEVLREYLPGLDRGDRGDRPEKGERTEHRDDRKNRRGGPDGENRRGSEASGDAA